MLITTSAEFAVSDLILTLSLASSTTFWSPPTITIEPPTGTATAYTNQMNTKAKTGGGLADILGMAINPIGGMLSKLF